MTDEQAKVLKKDILGENKVLYCMHSKPMTETCMCWGLEVPTTWLNEIDELSKKLEGMNSLVYPIHKVRIQADQVKEKFGTLRYYYSVVIDPPAWIHAYEKLIGWAMKAVGKLDFKLKAVVDREAYDEVIEEDVPSDKVNDAKKRYMHCSNVEVIDKPDGSATKKTTLHHPKRVHYEPTKHRWLYALFSRRWTVKNALRNAFKWKPTHSQECIYEVMDSYAFNAIRDTEERCMHICEHCGCHIGDEWRPTCMTIGWVSYLCEECAVEDGGIYVKDGKHWCNGKEVEDIEVKSSK